MSYIALAISVWLSYKISYHVEITCLSLWTLAEKNFGGGWGADRATSCTCVWELQGPGRGFTNWSGGHLYTSNGVRCPCFGTGCPNFHLDARHSQCWGAEHAQKPFQGWLPRYLRLEMLLIMLGGEGCQSCYFTLLRDMVLLVCCHDSILWSSDDYFSKHTFIGYGCVGRLEWRWGANAIWWKLKNTFPTTVKGFWWIHWACPLLIRRWKSFVWILAVKYALTLKFTTSMCCQGMEAANFSLTNDVFFLRIDLPI